ncbi:MAG: hypothetical protein HY866_06340, partial [Chloroflexi bacterium]|nr:hypothetical protein [Chloroflexota bacterium]
MKIKIALIVSLLCITSLTPGLVSATGPITAQDTLKTLINLGVLSSGDGELVFEVLEKQIDLSKDDNTFYYQYFNENNLVNFVMGATITWGPGAAEDDC